MANNLSKLDANQVLRSAYDDVSGALKTKITSTNISIQLDHLDGDSVTSHPAKLTASVSGLTAADNGTEVIPPLDASSLRDIRIDVEGTGTAEIWVSPQDAGTYFYLLGGEGVQHQICARRVKVISTNVVGNIHLVGRS